MLPVPVSITAHEGCTTAGDKFVYLSILIESDDVGWHTTLYKEETRLGEVNFILHDMFRMAVASFYNEKVVIDREKLTKLLKENK